jgi:hypothetical protein
MLLRSTFNKFHIQHLTAPRLAVRLCSATMPYSVPADLARQIRNNASSIPDVKKKPVPKQVGLPKGFLDGPASNVIRSRVDFTKGGLPEYEGAWAVVLDGVLSQEECDTIVAAAEETTNGTWERAMVNIGGGFQALYEDTRKCGRIMWDNKELAEKLLQRIDKEVLGEIDRLEKWSVVTGYGPFKRNEVWKMTRLNERLRFLKYTGGEYFKGEQTEWWDRRCIANKKKSALRWGLRNTRSQRAILLYSTTIPERLRRQGWRGAAGRRCYYLLFAQYETPHGCGAKGWPCPAVPTPRSYPFGRRRCKWHKANPEDGHYVHKGGEMIGAWAIGCVGRWKGSG